MSNSNSIQQLIRKYINDQQYHDGSVAWCDRTTLLDVVCYENSKSRELVDYNLWLMLESGEVVWEDERHMSVCLQEIVGE